MYQLCCPFLKLRLHIWMSIRQTDHPAKWQQSWSPGRDLKTVVDEPCLACLLLCFENMEHFVPRYKCRIPVYSGKAGSRNCWLELSLADTGKQGRQWPENVCGETLPHLSMPGFNFIHDTLGVVICVTIPKYLRLGALERTGAYLAHSFGDWKVQFWAVPLIQPVVWTSVGMLIVAWM
jgi:hypothetical protein